MASKQTLCSLNIVQYLVKDGVLLICVSISGPKIAKAIWYLRNVKPNTLRKSLCSPCIRPVSNLKMLCEQPSTPGGNKAHQFSNSPIYFTFSNGKRSTMIVHWVEEIRYLVVPHQKRIHRCRFDWILLNIFIILYLLGDTKKKRRSPFME